MKQKRDPSKIIGQDNLFGYVPRKNVFLRLENSDPLDILFICAAALTCECPLEISSDLSYEKEMAWLDLFPLLHVTDENTKTFLQKLESGSIRRLRMTEKAPPSFIRAAAKSGCYIIDSSPLANGRIELLHYTREVSVSYDYHRYGNLGLRESELRKLPY
jgi:RHH-type proline utilization regulon transcriptional repressor/proline dehydrogenase/delta 1-pyrroline-5-carboxylate dehydrogenase